MKIKAKENDGNRITKGKTYVVIEELDNVYEIICDTGNHYCAIKSIFDVVDEEKKPVKKVRCVNADDNHFIKVNHIYDVVSEYEDLICIINERNEKAPYYKSCFEVVEDDSKQLKVDKFKEEDSSYSSLKRVLYMAYDQASSGKGKERHANNDTFESQPICQIPRYQGSIDFVTGQAIKKCLEVTKLPTVDAKIRELLGAINYIAAGIIVLQEGSNDGN